MRRIIVRLGFIVLATGVAAWSTSSFHGTEPAHASGSCTVVQALSADVPAINRLDTATNMIAGFNHARQAEGCSVPLSIDPTAFSHATPQLQMFMLFNAERVDRGLGALRLDTTLLSQIDANHSKEMAQYSYFGHPSPINHPGIQHIFGRDTVNRSIARVWRGLGENIAAGYSPAGAVYAYMYTDSVDQWGHRHNVLGNFKWVGIGLAVGGFYARYFSSDFLNGPYTPPTAADTTAPILNAPVITRRAAGGKVIAQVTGVSDSGAVQGEAGITSVVISAGEPSQNSSGSANTVAATQTSPGVWTATLKLSVGATLYAVAVDGSGNYTDCATTSTSTNCQSGTVMSSTTRATMAPS